MQFYYQQSILWISLFRLLLISFSSIEAKPGLCEVEAGQSSSSIIVDIEESRGNQTSQLTSPAELPIVGDPYTEIVLNLVFPKGNPIFVLEGKQLKLVSQLDRDAENLSHIVFQLTCAIQSTRKKRTIPVIVRVSDINDNAPKFVNTPYETSISELTPIGSTIYKNLKAIDADAGVNGLVEYFLVPGNGRGLSNSDSNGLNSIKGQINNVADGFGYFSINLPHQGQVTLNRSLDYERTQKYLLTIVASKFRSNSCTGRNKNFKKLIKST